MLRSAVRAMAGMAAAVLVSGCAGNAVLKDERDLGEFRLGHNVVVADNAVEGPFSRDVTADRVEEVLSTEMERRLGRYEGRQLYHVGINVDGYVLAQPGIPLVAAPKSLMIVSVNVWDDAAGKKITDKPRQITIWETFSALSVTGGAGYTMSAEEQLENLAQNTVKEIEDWFEVRSEWFEAKPGLEDAPAGTEVAEARELPENAREIGAEAAAETAPVAPAELPAVPAAEAATPAAPEATAPEARPNPRPLPI